MTLADCHSRRMLDADSSVFFCAHPRMPAPRSLVTPELCRVCRLWREPAPEAFRPFAADGQSGPCFYLGKELGLRECKRCRGSVRQKTFACGHPLHGEAVLRDCRSCPDYEPLLATGAVKTWAVGLTTAPRQEPTLARCLESLAAAGWDSPIVFAEPEAEPPERARSLELVRRTASLGVIGNWLLGLSELLVREPAADAYLMVQDDVVFCRNVRGCLERLLWPAQRVGLVSVYRPGVYASPQAGLAPVDVGRGLMGAVAYVFPPPAARQLAALGGALAWRWRDYHEGCRRLDWLVGRWLRQAGLAAYYCWPSLAQHIGRTSTVWPGAPATGRRRASDFVGEAFDALRLAPQEADAIGQPFSLRSSVNHQHERMIP